jgi:hypothetical protein
MPTEHSVMQLFEVRVTLPPNMLRAAERYLAMGKRPPRMPLGHLIQRFTFRLPDEPELVARVDLVNGDAGPMHGILLFRGKEIVADFPPHRVIWEPFVLRHGGREYRVTLRSG